jgi:pimeloyl-ACP methyl ester carboxylesterase
MPPRKRLKKTKLQADNAAGSETLTVVYIHGIGNKPEPAILKRQYDQALFGIDMGGRTRMAYWADIRYPQPLPSGDVEGLSVASPDAFHPAAVSLDDSSNVRRLAPQGPQAEQYAAAVASKLLKEVASSDRKRINRVGEKILPGFIRKPVVEWITKTFIEDTAAYFFDPEQRELMRQRLRQILQAQTGPYILVAHSQGSIIAYDVLREFDGQPDIFHILLFVTIGSPLGLAEVQDHLQKPLRIPKVVQQWQNFADLFDSVAADKKLSDDFTNGKQPSDQIVVNSDTVSISHFNPHSGTGYLSTSQVRQTVRDQMGAALITPITPFVIARDIAAEMADPTVRLSVLIELKDEGSDLQTARTELDKELRQMEKNFKKQFWHAIVNTIITRLIRCAATSPPI